MLSIKPLRPAHREKKRYIVYEAEFEEGTFNIYSFQEHLVAKIKELLGVFESAQAGILPVKVDKEQHKGILRVNNKMVDKVRSCFVLINELERKPVRVSTTRVSGVLKKAKELEGFPQDQKKK